LNYIGSVTIPDWRYQSEQDKIMSVLFKTKKGWGRIEPSDDVSELRWFGTSELEKLNIVKEHVVLMTMLLEDLKK
jgi:hypothetical protein